MASALLLVAGLLAAVAFIVASTRLFRGPDVGSRVVAVDALTIIALPLMLLAAHYAGRAVYVDVTLVFAVLSFLAVLSLARYLEGGF